jgi:hypothetical protein
LAIRVRITEESIMGTPIMSHEELRQWLEWALNFSHPDDLARHVAGIAQALQLDTAVELAGQGLMDIVEQIAGVLQIDLHLTSNGGW